MASMTQRQESLIRTKPGHRIHLALEKLKMAFSSRPPHRRTINTQGLGEQMNSSNEATQRCPQRHAHQPQNTNSLRDTGDNTTHMVFEGQSVVKLHAKNVKIRTRANGNPRQEQVTMGRVDSPGSTNHQSLSFVRIQYHAPVIAPLLNSSQVPALGGSNSRSVCYLGNNCQ